MPELPEVETVRRQLQAVLPGRVVQAVDVLLPRTLQNIAPDELTDAVVGRAFRKVARRGKFLLLHIGDKARLIIHLRMTGRLFVVSAKEEMHPHTRLSFALRGGDELRFADVRTFGTLHYSSAPGSGEPPGLMNIGPEPLSEQFTWQRLAATLAGRKASLKAVLLDQRRVAGLGNIYVDEALYLARLHPERPAGTLREAEIRTLHTKIRSVLQEAIAAGGTTIRDYVDGEGAPGGFQHQLRAYGRAGRPCTRCGTLFERLKVAGRSSHVCPRCQS